MQNLSVAGDEVLVVLERESRRYRSRRKWRIWLGVAWFAVLCSMVAAESFFGLNLNSLWIHSVNIILPCLGLMTFAHKRALSKAIRGCDVGTIPYLVEALSLPNEDVKKGCRLALTELLPKLTEADQAIFDPHQRGILYRQLGALAVSPVGPNGPSFIGAVLCAIHRTGGVEAIPFLEDFERRARKKSGQWRKLADQALRFLPDLRMRAAKQIIDKKVDEVTADSEFIRERLGKLRDTGESLGDKDQEQSRLGADST